MAGNNKNTTKWQIIVSANDWLKQLAVKHRITIHQSNKILSKITTSKCYCYSLNNEWTTRSCFEWPFFNYSTINRVMPTVARDKLTAVQKTKMIPAVVRDKSISIPTMNNVTIHNKNQKKTKIKNGWSVRSEFFWEKLTAPPPQKLSRKIWC